MDTGAYLALANPSDPNHDESLRCIVAVAHRHVPLFVTTATIAEAYSRILYDVDERSAKLFLDGAIDGKSNVLPVGLDAVVQAAEFMTTVKYLALSLIDALNMVAMRQLGIAGAFTFDEHFSRAGFLVVPPLGNLGI